MLTPLRLMEAPLTWPAAPAPTLRHIRRVVTSAEEAALLQYARLLLAPDEVGHYSWPLFDCVAFRGVAREELYETSGEPRETFVHIVAEAVVRQLEAGDLLTILWDDAAADAPGQGRLLGAGLSGRPGEAENDLWLSKAVVARGQQGMGYGTLLAKARLDEVFIRFPALANVYVGVTYAVRLTDAAKMGLARSIGHLDILQALRQGKAVAGEDLAARVDALQAEIALHGHPLQVPPGALEELAAHLLPPGAEPLRGLSGRALHIRRMVLTESLHLLGLPMTATERVYLKLGAYHTQLLSEQCHTIDGRDWPTARLVVKRALWERPNTMSLSGQVWHE